MKTWWNFLWLVALGLLAPLIGLMPTFSVNGNMLGGGPIRQFAVNLLASHLPVEKGNILVSAFMNSGTGKEILIYLPIAINMMAILLLIIYAFGQTIITINNFVVISKFKKLREYSKQ